MKDKIEAELDLESYRTLCAELYQVIGVLADKAGVFDADAVERALDNSLAGAEGLPLPHVSVLPFVLA